MEKRLSGCPRPPQLREYALREFWEIIVDDRRFYRDSSCKPAHVQPKADFFFAMTVMDKICGWEDEEHCVGSKFAACMWICSNRVLTGGQKPTPEMEVYLKRRLLSIMLCMSCVFAGSFDDHEWVSESTITGQEEVMGKELDYEICIPCVVQWCMLWLSAPTRLNRTLRRDLKTQKRPEAVDKAIAQAISRPFGRTHTPMTCMLTLVAAVLHKNKGSGCEQGDGRMGDGR